MKTKKKIKFVTTKRDIRPGDITNIGVVLSTNSKVQKTVHDDNHVLIDNGDGVTLGIVNGLTNWTRIERICELLLKNIDTRIPLYKSYLNPLSGVWVCDIEETIRRCKDKIAVEELLETSIKKQTHIIKKKTYKKFGL